MRLPMISEHREFRHRQLSEKEEIMTSSASLDRGRVLKSAAALGAYALAGNSTLAAGKPFEGTELNVSCWSAPFPKLLQAYLPEFEKLTGIKVNYDTPDFLIYNQRDDLELSTKGSSYDVSVGQDILRRADVSVQSRRWHPAVRQQFTDAARRSSSRNQHAHSAAAASGQPTFTAVAPQHSSIVVSWAAVTADLSRLTGMNARFSTLARRSAAWTVSIGLTGGGCSSVTTQRRSRFAFSPFAKATAAIDTPGCRQASTTFALNSAVCVRRRRQTTPWSEVSICPPKTQVDTIILSRTWSSKMTLPVAYRGPALHVFRPCGGRLAHRRP